MNNGVLGDFFLIFYIIIHMCLVFFQDRLFFSVFNCIIIWNFGKEHVYGSVCRSR